MKLLAFKSSRPNAPEYVKQLEFLDTLVAIREEPHEIESYVDGAAKVAIEGVIAELRSNNECVPDELVYEIVDCFYGYIYMGEWPKNPKPRILNASYNIISGFFVMLPMNLKNIAFAFDPRRFNIIATLYRILDRGGMEVKLATRLKHIAGAQRELSVLELEGDSPFENKPRKVTLN